MRGDTALRRPKDEDYRSWPRPDFNLSPDADGALHVLARDFPWAVCTEDGTRLRVQVRCATRDGAFYFQEHGWTASRVVFAPNNPGRYLTLSELREGESA